MSDLLPRLASQKSTVAVRMCVNVVVWQQWNVICVLCKALRCRRYRYVWIEVRRTGSVDSFSKGSSIWSHCVWAGRHSSNTQMDLDSGVLRYISSQYTVIDFILLGSNSPIIVSMKPNLHSIENRREGVIGRHLENTKKKKSITIWESQCERTHYSPNDCET